MSHYRLTDILKAKKSGDEWYCIEAPEEVQMWSYKKPWSRNLFDEYGVEPCLVSIRAGSGTGEGNTEKFTKKSPMRLDNGILLDKGQISTAQTVNASFTIPFDSPVEFNETMKELSEKTGLFVWEVKRLKVWGNGGLIEYKKHNPNGTGAALLLFRVTKEKISKLYPDIMLSEQLALVGKFQERTAHCTATEQTELIHACALKLKTKKRQLKLRKKSG